MLSNFSWWRQLLKWTKSILRIKRFKKCFKTFPVSSSQVGLFYSVPVFKWLPNTSFRWQINRWFSIPNSRCYPFQRRYRRASIYLDEFPHRPYTNTVFLLEFPSRIRRGLQDPIFFLRRWQRRPENKRYSYKFINFRAISIVGFSRWNFRYVYTVK